jgi:hypothetical protein
MNEFIKPIIYRLRLNYQKPTNLGFCHQYAWCIAACHAYICIIKLPLKQLPGLASDIESIETHQKPNFVGIYIHRRCRPGSVVNFVPNVDVGDCMHVSEHMLSEAREEAGVGRWCVIRGPRPVNVGYIYSL